MGPLRLSLIAVTVAGLAIDAYIHLTLAGGYDAVQATFSQGQLFRVEAVMAIIAAAALIIRPNRITAALAALVAGGGTFALLLYLFVDVGAIGPLPNMYEPVWYSEKVITMVAQTVATITAVILVVIGARRSSPQS